MGEDRDEDSVPRFSRIFVRVQDAIIEELNVSGFDVFDEAAASLGNFAQDRVRRADPELIDIARSVTRPPIDVVVVFSIFASVEELRYASKIRARVTGRMLNVKTGQRLGSFEVENERGWNAPLDCPRDCVLETVGRYSKTLAEDVGNALAFKLTDLVQQKQIVTGSSDFENGLGNAFVLMFRGFDQDDHDAIEEYIHVFSGYKRHRPTSTNTRTFEIWYETNSSSAKLQRNLRKMVQLMGVNAQVSFSGNDFKILKLRTRKKLNVDKNDFE